MPKIHSKFQLSADKPLREQKKLPAKAREKLMKANGEIKKMQQDWTKILEKHFSGNYTKRAADWIRCESYESVLNNWDAIRSFLDSLRASGKDLPWPECLPRGILSCRLCTDYVNQWAAVYHG